MPFGSFYSPRLEKVSGIVFVNTSTGLPHILIDESATEEEAQNMISWVRDSKKGNS
jgi:deoxyribose-phosphate aldolase